MKKMIISILACMVIDFGSLVAFELYIDWLACLLFICALIPSCLLEGGRQEYKEQKNGTCKSV